MNPRYLRPAKWFAVCILAVALVTMWARQITGAPVEKDSAQLVRMAVDLERHGVMSLEEAAPYEPTDYREPLPVLACALGIKIMDSVLGTAPEDAYFSGERVKYLKYQNFLWLSLLCAGAFWAAYALSSSFLCALAAMLLVNVPFTPTHFGAGLIDGLFSEIPAAAGFIFACACLAIGFARQRLGYIALAGILFGIVTLIKAAVLYVFIGVALLLGCIYLLNRTTVAARTAVRDLAVFIITFFCVLAPWMYRNHVELGSFQLSQRAGVVLEYRALKDQMTPLEYRGAFYVWAPSSLQKSIGRILGFSPSDLHRGGRLQRLNTSLDSDFAADDLAAERSGRPDKTLTYYRQARAERVKIEQELGAAGHPQAEIEGDEILKKRAMTLIAAHPWRHLALTVPFMWRGATFVFPILIFALITAIRWRRYDIALFALPSLGLVTFYALFSHFIARYAVPAHLVTLVLVAVLTTLAFSKTKSAFSG